MKYETNMSDFLRFSNGERVIGNASGRMVSGENPNQDLRTLQEQKIAKYDEFMEQYRMKPRNSAVGVPVNFYASYYMGTGVDALEYEPFLSFANIIKSLKLSNINSLMLGYTANIKGNTPTYNPGIGDFTVPIKLFVWFYDIPSATGEKLLILNAGVANINGTTGRASMIPTTGLFDLFDTMPYRAVNNLNQPDYSGTIPNSDPTKITVDQLDRLLNNESAIVAFYLGINFNDFASLSAAQQTAILNNSSSNNPILFASLTPFGLLSSFEPIGS